MGLRNDAKAEGSVENIQIFRDLAPAHGLQHVKLGDLARGVELQEVVHVVGGEGAHVVPAVGVADLGHPAHPLGPVVGVGHHLAELDA